jgi:hypothetical protein
MREVKISYNKEVEVPTLKEFADIHGKHFLIFPEKEREEKIEESYKKTFGTDAKKERKKVPEKKGKQKKVEDNEFRQDSEETEGTGSN